MVPILKQITRHAKKEFTVTINFSYNDADLDYLYDYYNPDDYDDHLSSRQKQHEGSGIKAISDFPNGKDDNHGKRGRFLVDLPIVNQRENGVEFFPTPSSTDNRRKFTTLTAR